MTNQKFGDFLIPPLRYAILQYLKPYAFLSQKEQLPSLRDIIYEWSLVPFCFPVNNLYFLLFSVHHGDHGPTGCLADFSLHPHTGRPQNPRRFSTVPRLRARVQETFRQDQGKLRGNYRDRADNVANPNRFERHSGRSKLGPKKQLSFIHVFRYSFFIFYVKNK